MLCLETVENKEHWECSTYQTAENPHEWSFKCPHDTGSSKCLDYPWQQRQQSRVSQTQEEPVLFVQ